MKNEETLEELEQRQKRETDSIYGRLRFYDRDDAKEVYKLGIKHTEERQEWFGSRVR